ncbi:MAG TPA: hypothetical protein VLF43_04625 [Candidatus Saccharimonadales bacterium]|nr:hypothetical protein [Candidatus Saccharimonadales bacterium]
MNITTLKKPLLIAGAVATIGVAGLTGLGVASAATSTSGNDSLVSKIATKFGLKEADVQAVFDADKTEHEAERQAAFSERLQTLVDNGKITADQKTLIENKAKELQSARETEMNDLKTWASQQGIDMQYLMHFGGPGSSDSDDRLQRAVDDGKITTDQKSAIEAKQKELETKRESDRTALDKWASDNGIDTQYLMFGARGGPGLRM